MIRSGLKRIGRKLLGRGKPSGKPAPAEPSPRPAPSAAKAPSPAAPSRTSPGGERAQRESLPEPVQTVGQAAPKRTPASPPPETAAPQPAAGGSSFAALAALAASGQLGEARHADQSGTDLEAYAERMRVNGRDDVELAGVGLNTADDGVQFVGPVDNESSRAKAAGQVLSIDQEECISCGTCVEQTEDVFFLGEDDKQGEEVKAEVLKQEGPMDLIQDAIDACPVTCIAWMDEGELCEIHSAGGR
ncbi:MAG: ferredoxin [Myxococcota bacterium]|nr:ferredoxin [Myxococcota bacterium]